MEFWDSLLSDKSLSAGVYTILCFSMKVMVMMAIGVLCNKNDDCLDSSILVISCDFYAVPWPLEKNLFMTRTNILNFRHHRIPASWKDYTVCDDNAGRRICLFSSLLLSYVLTQHYLSIIIHHSSPLSITIHLYFSLSIINHNSPPVITNLDIVWYH